MCLPNACMEFRNLLHIYNTAAIGLAYFSTSYSFTCTPPYIQIYIHSHFHKLAHNALTGSLTLSVFKAMIKSSIYNGISSKIRLSASLKLRSACLGMSVLNSLVVINTVLHYEFMCGRAKVFCSQNPHTHTHTPSYDDGRGRENGYE